MVSARLWPDPSIAVLSMVPTRALRFPRGACPSQPAAPHSLRNPPHQIPTARLLLYARFRTAVRKARTIRDDCRRPIRPLSWDPSAGPFQRSALHSYSSRGHSATGPETRCAALTGLACFTTRRLTANCPKVPWGRRAHGLLRAVGLWPKPAIPRLRPAVWTGHSPAQIRSAAPWGLTQGHERTGG